MKNEHSVSKVVCTLAFLTAALCDARAADTDQPLEFNIPPQRLESALLAFSEQSGTQIGISGVEIATQKTQGISGRMPARVALARLIEGSDLKIRESGERSYSLVAAQEPVGATSASAAQGAAQATEASDSKKKDQSTRLNDSSSRSGNPSPLLETILVTAQKRQERLLDVPVPVSTISGASLAESSQVLLRDYYSKIPNLNLTPGTQSAQILSIRGITTGRGNPTVGVTVDDVPYGSSFGLGGGEVVPDIDPGDLARVEVLRGPQGTLYGPSSMGGLLKFVTIDPSTSEVSGRLQAGVTSVEHGNDIGYNFRGSINLPLGETIAARASGFYRQDPGYIDNLQTGERDVNSAEATGGRLSLLWKPSSDTSVKLGALIQDIEGDGSSDAHVGLGEFEQRTLINTGWYKRHVRAYDAIVNTRFGKVDLTSVTGYNINSYTGSQDFSYGYASTIRPIFGVTGAPILNDNETKKFTQEFRLTVPLTERIELLAGAFYTDEKSYIVQNVPAQDATTGATVGRYLYIDVPTTYSDLAAFADLTFQLTDRLSLQVGGRQSWLHQTFEQTVITAVTSTSETVAVTPRITTEPDVFTYLVTPQFKITPNWMAYARMASGYRAGGTSAGTGVPPQYAPDKTQNYELGFKGDFFDGALTLDASVYYIDWKDLQLAVRPQVLSFITNASEAESKGVELAIGSHPLTGLTINASFVWSDAVLTEDFPPAAARVAYGRDGDRLPWSSRISGSLSVQQEFHITDDLSGYVGATGSYIGDREGIFRPATAPTREVFPSYTKTDLTLGLRLGAWTANAFVNNVTDEKGVLWGGIGAVPPFGYVYIQPRTYGMSVTHQF